MIKRGAFFFIFVISAILIVRCAATRTNVSVFSAIVSDLQVNNYQAAIQKIDLARKNKEYTKKDRVLFYLDKGSILHYQGDYEKSNEHLEAAEQAMEELFTRSISKAALSFLLNDNALDYFGEIYENLYVNVFKAINYLKLGKFDDAYVEVKRMNTKLRELDDKYGQLVRGLNQSKDAGNTIEYEKLNYYNNALSHYLSYLIFRAEGEQDNARISFDKIKEAYRTHPDIYNFPLPNHLHHLTERSFTKLNVLAFTGLGPFKRSAGGMITTYEDYVGISDLSVPLALPNIPFPGVKEGYHFKFAFPVLQRNSSAVTGIEVLIDGRRVGRLELFEDMGQVAQKTFNAHRKIIIMKTIVRTISKGLAAAEAKKKLRKETGAKGILGDLLDAAVDVSVDATENADLRCWRTMPDKCYVGEFPVQKGNHTITVHFLNNQGLVVQNNEFKNFQIGDRLNLVNVTSLN